MGAVAGLAYGEVLPVPEVLAAEVTGVTLGAGKMQLQTLGAAAEDQPDSHRWQQPSAALVDRV